MVLAVDRIKKIGKEGSVVESVCCRNPHAGATGLVPSWENTKAVYGLMLLETIAPTPLPCMVSKPYQYW
jgi:hypothetical protein